MKPETVARWGRWVRWHTPILARPFRRRAVTRLAHWRLTPTAIPHLIAALESPDARVSQTATQALGALSDNPACVDALCAAWAKRRDATLAKLIAECRYQAASPVELRVLSGLQAGRLDELAANDDPAVVSALVEALADTDRVVADRACTVLNRLQSQKARDALIEIVLANPVNSAYFELINQHGYRHSDEGQWFLYLVLAGRYEDYLREDFEFQRLRPEYHATTPAIQARIRDAIVCTGDTRMNPLFVQEKKQTVLADLSDHDADLLVKLNARNRNWDTLFKFLWVLPVRHIRDAVGAMSNAGWQPEDADRQALFHKLTGLMETVGEASKSITAPVLLNPVLKQWLERGEKEWAKEPESKLREWLTDEVPPPDQIAALGALRVQGQLTPEVLDQAGRSQQWLVRLVAAALGGQAQPVNDGGKEWFTRLQIALDAESVWGLKPCHVTRDGLEALQEGLARLPDRHVAGGLNLLEAVVAHYTAHDIEIEVGARVVVGEDSFEIGG